MAARSRANPNHWTIHRVDPDTGAIELEIDPRVAAGRDDLVFVPDLAVAGGDLWAASSPSRSASGANLLLRIDPVTGAVRSTIAIPGDVDGLVASDRYLWALSFNSRNITRLRLADEATETIPLPLRPVGATANGDYLEVTVQRDRFDTETLRIHQDQAVIVDNPNDE